MGVGQTCEDRLEHYRACLALGQSPSCFYLNLPVCLPATAPVAFTAIGPATIQPITIEPTTIEQIESTITSLYPE
jgi:hypothetical protein